MDRHSVTLRVADEVRVELTRQRMTMRQLSQVAGIPQGRLYRRLSGASPFTIYELAAVAEALGVPLDRLVASGSAA